MRNNHKWLILSLLGIGFFLRLFKLQQLFYFSMDEAYVAFRAWGLFVLKRPFLIGAAGPLQFHLPPYFFYLSSILLTPFNFNPVGWGVWAALLGLLTIYLLYRLTDVLTNRSTGLIAATLYSTSFTAIFFDRHYWPLNLNPLYLVITLILLIKLKSQSFWPYLGLATILVMAITSDPSNIPLVLVVISYFIINQKQLNHRFQYLSLISAIVFFFTPLVVFDLRHNWQNLLSISNLFTNTSQLNFSLQNFTNALLLLPRSLARFWYSPQTNITNLHTYCIPHASARQQHLPLILVLLAAGLLFWLITKNLRSKQPILRITSLLLIYYLIGISIYAALGYSVFDHYFSGLLPIFALLTALIINRLPKTIGLLALTTLICSNLFQFSKAHNPYGLVHKQQLVAWAVDKLEGQTYVLNSISKCHRENGLRYLFELTHHPPQQSFMDPNFAWLYRQPPSTTKPSRQLLVTDKPLDSSLTIINQQSFGAMDAYILDNLSSSSNDSSAGQ
jgi:hypothetical protein